jgi:hypothetical protein
LTDREGLSRIEKHHSPVKRLSRGRLILPAEDALEEPTHSMALTAAGQCEGFPVIVDAMLAGIVKVFEGLELLTLQVLLLGVEV